MSGIDVFGLRDSNQIPYQASHAHPYASSLSSSASSSSSSVFSLDGLSTQSSISSTSTNSVDVIWENDGDSQVAPRGRVPAGPARCGFRAKNVDAPVAPELRRHPRRTNSGPVQANGVPGARPPPALLRQSERKVNFVDNLVDSASQIVETIWPLSAAAHRSDAATGCKGVLPLRTFIQETLRRSRTSYSTLQVALYYLIKIKSHVPSPDASPDQNGGKPVCRAMQCGRRMFLAALILASKYLQDRNYSARAWSKISGLNTTEINQNELMFLGAVSWRLHIPEALFQRWTDIVLKLTQGGLAVGGLTWQAAIPRLTPELDGELEAGPVPGPPTPTSMRSYDARFSESPSPRGSSTRGSGSCSAAPPGEPCTLPSIHESFRLFRQTSPVGLPSISRLDGSQGMPPSLPRPPMLPTPQLTPQSLLAGTPAVSAGGAPSHRRHICSAMSQAHHAGLARSTIDQRPPPSMCPRASTFDGYPTVRRSSLARSSSSASSPDSMVSDVSTLSSSSRSSSVSSSSASGPGAVSLPRLATLRCTNNSLKDGRRPLNIVSPIDESVFSDFYNSPDVYGAPLSHAPDFSRFSLGTPVDLNSAHEAAQGLCELSGAVSRPTTGPSQRPCRKRGRAGSDDLSLPDYVSGSREDTPVLPSGHVMNRFLNSKTLSAAQLRALSATPVSGPVGMKRACCGSETQKIALHPSVRAEY